MALYEIYFKSNDCKYLLMLNNNNSHGDNTDARGITSGMIMELEASKNLNVFTVSSNLLFAVITCMIDVYMNQ